MILTSDSALKFELLTVTALAYSLFSWLTGYCLN